MQLKLIKVLSMDLAQYIKSKQMAASPFWLIALVLQTPTYKLAKSLVPILNILIKKEYTVRKSHQFAEGDL